jgi:hypothetical protein
MTDGAALDARAMRQLTSKLRLRTRALPDATLLSDDSLVRAKQSLADRSERLKFDPHSKTGTPIAGSLRVLGLEKVSPGEWTEEKNFDRADSDGYLCPWERVRERRNPVSRRRSTRRLQKRRTDRRVSDSPLYLAYPILNRRKQLPQALRYDGGPNRRQTNRRKRGSSRRSSDERRLTFDRRVICVHPVTNTRDGACGEIPKRPTLFSKKPNYKPDAKAARKLMSDKDSPFTERKFEKSVKPFRE